MEAFNRTRKPKIKCVRYLEGQKILAAIEEHPSAHYLSSRGSYSLNLYNTKTQKLLRKVSLRTEVIDLNSFTLCPTTGYLALTGGGYAFFIDYRSAYKHSMLSFAVDRRASSPNCCLSSPSEPAFLFYSSTGQYKIMLYQVKHKSSFVPRPKMLSYSYDHVECKLASAKPGSSSSILIVNIKKKVRQILAIEHILLLDSNTLEVLKKYDISQFCDSIIFQRNSGTFLIHEFKDQKERITYDLRKWTLEGLDLTFQPANGEQTLEISKSVSFDGSMSMLQLGTLGKTIACLVDNETGEIQCVTQNLRSLEKVVSFNQSLWSLEGGIERKWRLVPLAERLKDDCLNSKYMNKNIYEWFNKIYSDELSI